MPDHRLNQLTPLGNDAPEAITIGAVTIVEVVEVALASLASRAVRESDLAEAARKAGIPLPAPGRSEQAATYGAFWMSPDMWMVEAPFASHEDIAAILRPLLGDTASITEQTDAWARFEVSGSSLPELFARLSPVDLSRPEAGGAIRTVIEHLGCFLLVRDSRRIHVLSARSSARSLHHSLLIAAHSIS